MAFPLCPVALCGTLWRMGNLDSGEDLPDLLTIKATAAKLSLSIWSVYQLCDNGRLESVYQGARRFVVADSVPAYIKSLSAVPEA